MSTAQIQAMIDGPVATHDPWAYATYQQVLQGYVDVPPTVGDVPDQRQDIRSLIGSDDYARNARLPGYADLDSLISGQVVGHTGASLDGPPTVHYRADKPGFGGFNDQPMQSAETNGDPGVVSSREVGTGKPPGWVVAHMPLAEGVNPTRSSYVYQGVFADGQEYFPADASAEQTRSRQIPARAPWWPDTLAQPGQSPSARAMWPGSAVVEQPPALSLSQILGRAADTLGGWGVQ